MGKSKRQSKATAGRWGKQLERLRVSGPWPFQTDAQELDAELRSVTFAQMKAEGLRVDDRPRVDGRLEKLSTRELVVLFLRRLNRCGLPRTSWSVIARTLRVSITTVKADWKRARKKMEEG